MNNTCAHSSMVLVQSVLDAVINQSLQAVSCILNKGYRKPREGSSLANITSWLPTCARSSLSAAAAGVPLAPRRLAGAPRLPRRASGRGSRGSLVSLPLMRPGERWALQGVRCRVLGGLCKATQFPNWKLETWECICSPHSMWIKCLFVALRASPPALIAAEDIALIMRFTPFGLPEHWHAKPRTDASLILFTKY